MPIHEASRFHYRTGDKPGSQVNDDDEEEEAQVDGDDDDEEDEAEIDGGDEDED